MKKKRRLGGVVLTTLLVISAGCVTVNPAIESSSNGSNVFKNVTTSNEWGTSSIHASITLSPNATTEMGVSRLNVITSSGSSFYSTTVDSGQTSVSMPLPSGGSAQIIAVNTINGSVVDTYNITVTGSSYP